ncbi:WD repeat-containing protein 93 isoform X2 [Mugil cephalus]|uniref:WD repeat-containing protein 93 isoform X2 n=1 Tax=Mugil cephalus TaxID=48193 RepID=UPI001FB66DF4|nr:WD repeat-containing protein 93 isoform X2 [Mugil cephalus]
MEGAQKSSREEPSTLEMTSVAQLPENTNCLSCSEDGRYLSLGHSLGLSVWCASTFIRVAEWLQDTMEITSIQMTGMSETTYLLGTVDDMGVARVFALHSDDIHLLNVINPMEDVNQRSVCLSFELYKGGHYGAASFSCNGGVWLEIYLFPSAAWLNELEMALAQKQDPNSSEDLDVRWSGVTVMTKIKPPTVAAVSALDGAVEVGQTADFSTHCLALDVIMSHSSQQDNSSSDTDAGKTKETTESPRRCTQHFLLPCGQCPGDSKADFKSGLPVAVAVWWSGSRNLLQYLLQNAPRNKPDVNPRPDVLWPNAKEIVCSAVSRCTRYVALGLDDALLCVWDRRSGAPLCVVLVSTAHSAFFRVQFMDCWAVSADASQVFAEEKIHLLVECKGGALHTVTTGRGTQSCTMQLSERPADSRDLPTVYTAVPFLQRLSLVVQRNGKMSLQDVINKTTVCFLTPATESLITTPCNPIYALNNKQQTLFIRGDQDARSSAFSEETSQSQLLTFCFGESDVLKQYILSHPDKQTKMCYVTLEETCNLYLQQRMLSAEERNKVILQTWEQLQETAAMVQERQRSCSQVRSCHR